MFYYEDKLKKQGYDFVIGVDEAGRGPLAGPVVAAAVVLRDKNFKNRIDDSKKLTAGQREKAFPEIVSKSFFGVGIVNELVIDRVNILVATRMAMEQAISAVRSKLKSENRQKPHVLVDGNMNLSIGLPVTEIIRGDSKSKSIASASIIAKVIRDRIMRHYDKIYPEYGFFQHKGYPTQMHRAALKQYGPSKIHRKTFYGV